MKTDLKLMPFISCLAFLTLTACTMTQQQIGNPETPYPQQGPPAVGDIYHLPTGVKVTPEEMHQAITDSRIIYVGETHDNPAAHRLELDVLEAVTERYPGKTSLGMEMFNTTQQDILNQWTNGIISEKDFLKKSDWYGVWGQDFAYYRDLLVYARNNKIPVIGLNVTKELRRKVGMNELADLDKETLAQLPEMDFSDPYQKAMTEAIYADHTQGKSMLDGFLRIQTLWDESMAENIARDLATKPDHRMVVIAGGNHVRYGFGIPRRVFRRLPVSYSLVGIREINLSDEKKSTLMNVDMPQFPMVPYDYQLYSEYESLPGERVKLGVRFKEADGRILVESVVPGSAADKAGMMAGDYIEFFDNKPVKESFDLVYEISLKNLDDKAEIIVDREEKPISLTVHFIPLPEMHGQEKHGMKK